MNSLFAKSGITVFLVITLLVPLSMISSLVDERKERQEQVYAAMGTSWGGHNTAMGGIIMTRGGDSAVPDRTRIDANLQVHERNRGIFSIPFYSANMVIRGTFDNPGRLSGKNRVNLLVFNNSSFEVQQVKINGRNIPFYIHANGTIPNAYVLSAFNHADYRESRVIEVEAAITLKGIDRFLFQQISKNTHIDVRADWANPSFTGSNLPAERSINEKGFSAKWEMSDLVEASNASPQLLNEESVFGVSLFMPVNIYSLTDRSIKYAILFIGLTFMACFLFEIFAKLRIHPFQYLMVGFALTIFYLLLLSISEFLSFGLSYFIAASAVVLLVTFYSRTMLRARERSLIMGGMIALLYLFLYILLQLEQYSLLLGSLALFILLAAVMYLTRNINWYEVRNS